MRIYPVGLLQSLIDQDSSVRGGAAWALGRIGARQAIADISGLLVDGDDWVRRDAVQALGELGAKVAIPEIVKLLATIGGVFHLKGLMKSWEETLDSK